jgi:hypothetical protein
MKNWFTPRVVSIAVVTLGVAGVTINHGVAIRYAPPGSFPWQVFVVAGDKECGGVVFEENWVLTAAHCLEGLEISDVRIVAGDQTPADATRVEPELIVRHPRFLEGAVDNAPRPNDIALLRVPRLLRDGVSGIEPVSRDAEGFEQLLFVAGWACKSRVVEAINWLTMRIFDCQGRLVFTDVRERHRDVCNREIGTLFVCAGGSWYQQTTSGVDENDSGGGLVTLIQGDAKLVGIVGSNGFSYDKYARVVCHEKWIRACIGDAASAQCKNPDITC